MLQEGGAVCEAHHLCGISKHSVQKAAFYKVLRERLTDQMYFLEPNEKPSG